MMTNPDILSQLTDLFRDVLDNPAIQLQLTTTAADIEEWDSITHIQLIVAIEKKFKVKFTSSEIRDWKTVGEIADSIRKRMA